MKTVEEFEREWFDDRPYVEARTSGSTGKPKAIRLLKQDMLRSAEATNRFFGITARSRMVCPLSLDYIAGKMMWVRAFQSGAEVHFTEPSMAFDSSVYEEAVDLLPIVPAQIEGLLASPHLQNIKNVIVGGAPVSIAQERELIASGVCSWATYGMTETCSHVALRRIGVDKYFRGLPYYMFSVDSRGCLTIENPNMSFKRLTTNDIVELRSDGTFKVSGRYDNVIISGGEKIFPEEMEHSLSARWNRSPFYLTSCASERWGAECIAVMEGNSDATEEAEFIALCRSLFPRHHVPKRVVRVEHFERTDSGKLKRHKF